MAPSSYGTFSADHVDDSQCSDVISQLKARLETCEVASIRYNLLTPPEFIEKISLDIIRMSCLEPCGLKGCVIHVNLERKHVCERLCQIELDRSTVTTFEISLTLIEWNKPWLQIKNFFRPLVLSCMQERAVREVAISPGYKLVKKKLYCQHS
eukprot:GHVT01018311.1.p1 GENE.GHVT01018311.1~~GHVT01018311.1.p1  ORF type:complete len:176 (+),score=0.85 GHVT01018311.1:72-530(+)